MNKDLVSIIIPVYNVKEFLKECVESVVQQSYKKLEIILVDDGSTDGSEKLCDNLAKEDDRIKVIHQRNQGLSAARNSGISIMKGTYVYFLDSDDCIANDAIEVLYKALQRGDTDMAISGIIAFSDSKPVIAKNGYTESFLETEVALTKMLLHDGIGHEACGKLFKAELWLKYRFPVGLLYEDYATIYYVASQSKKVAISKYPSYFYRVRSGSIMHSEIQERNFILLDISDEVTDFLIKRYPVLKEAAIRLNVVTYLKVLKMILDINMNAYISVQKRIIKHIKKHKNSFLDYGRIRSIDKIKIYALEFGKYPFYCIYCVGDFINNLKLKYNKQ